MRLLYFYRNYIRNGVLSFIFSLFSLSNKLRRSFTSCFHTWETSKWLRSADKSIRFGYIIDTYTHLKYNTSLCEPLLMPNTIFEILRENLWNWQKILWGKVIKLHNEIVERFHLFNRTEFSKNRFLIVYFLRGINPCKFLVCSSSS